MKKKLFIAMVAATAALSTACGTSVPNLSKVDNSKAAEYMAGELLKYDEDYAFALDYDRSVLEPTPPPAKTLPPAKTAEKQKKPGQGGTAGSDTPEAPAVQEVSVAEVLGMDGVSIEPVSSSVKTSYGKGYESLVASEGKKLFIIYFKIKNTAGTDQKVNLSKDGLQYQLSLAGSSVSPLRTLVEGDLQYFNSVIPSGKSEQGVLLFEIDKNANADGASLMIMNGMKQATVPLK